MLALPLALLQSTEVRTHADSEEFHIRLRTKRGLEVTIHIAPDHECLLEHAQRVHAARRLLHHVYQFAFTVCDGQMRWQMRVCSAVIVCCLGVVCSVVAWRLFNGVCLFIVC